MLQATGFLAFDGGNAVVSSFLFILGTQLITGAALYRYNKRINYYFHGVVLLLLTGGVMYFYYFDNDLFARIYLVNFGMAYFFLSAVFRLRQLVWGTGGDRILLGCLFVVGIHFFPRVFFSGDTVTKLMLASDYRDSFYWDNTSFWAALLAIALGVVIILSVGMEVIAHLKRDRDTDILTGLLNRRGLVNRRAAEEEHKRIRTDSIIMCDIDYFKSINDIYGHTTGDKVLKQFGSILANAVGEHDLAVRLGGEEFLLVLHQKSVESAYILIEKLRNEIEETVFDGLDDNHILTCSFGIAKVKHNEDIWKVIERADKILYKAKSDGRNRIYAEDTNIPLNYPA